MVIQKELLEQELKTGLRIKAYTINPINLVSCKT